MKKLLALTLMVMTAAGCSQDGGDSTGPATPAPEAGERPVVYATSYPLSDFVQRIAGDTLDVRFPVPADQDAAHWRPAAQDVLAMQQAELIVLNGASYEGWLKNVSLPPSRLVDTTAGLEDRLIPLTRTTTHSHGPEGEHEHSGTASTTWLDPTLAAAQAAAVQQALAARWPQHADLFEMRLTALTEQLTALDGAIQDAVAGRPGLPLLFSHPVYQYLVRRYGLDARSVHVAPDRMPDEAAWQELAATLEQFPARWMIWQATPLPEIAGRLEALGVRSAVFDPCANTPAGRDYLQVMAENVQALQRVFAADP